MRALHHLQPPSGACRIALERFSPNFNDPGLGFTGRTPARIYDYIYRLPDDALKDLVYLFGCDPQGINGAMESMLTEAVETWRAAYLHSELSYESVDPEHWVIHDRRACWDHRDIHLDAAETALYALLQRPSSMSTAVGRIADLLPAPRVESTIANWLTSGLLYFDGQRYVALAVPCDSGRIRLPW
jgi:magnesium-protoporphyrin IX monomethyl ester (oxidative) cyclase